MSNNKQSSVELFAKTLAEQGLLPTRDYKNLVAYQQAKAMHKEETLKLYNDFQDYLDEEFKNQCGGQGNILTFEQYYNITFGGNNE